MVDEDALPIFKYRLFGAGLQGQLFEIDLKEMRVVVQSDSYGGPVWMADRHPNNDTLACACEDGSLAPVRFIGRTRDVLAFYSDVRITTSFFP